MHLVTDRLARGHEPIATIAYALGYESEGAFTVAFKRVLGCAPGRYAGAGPARLNPLDGRPGLRAGGHRRRSERGKNGRDTAAIRNPRYERATVRAIAYTSGECRH